MQVLHDLENEKVSKQAEKVFIELIKLLFDIKEVERLISKDNVLLVEQITRKNKLLDDIGISVTNSQRMVTELHRSLDDLGIRVIFPEIPDEKLYSYNKIIDSRTNIREVSQNIVTMKKWAEELQWHIGNVLKVMKAISDNKNEDKVNSESIKKYEVRDALEFGRKLVLSVRVVEGELDVITDCRPVIGTIHLTGIDTYNQILEIFNKTEKLCPKLKRFEEQLEKIGIYEKLEFSMDGPLENAKNYLFMLLIPKLKLRELLKEKYEQIQELRNQIDSIIVKLNEML